MWALELFTGKWLTLGAFGGTDTYADAIDVGMWVGHRYPDHFLTFPYTILTFPEQFLTIS